MSYHTRTPAQVNAAYPGIFGLFGYMTDMAISLKYGCARGTISYIRRGYGVAVGEASPPDLLAQAAEVPERLRAHRPGRTTGGMYRRCHKEQYLGMGITVFVWAHTPLDQRRCWMIAIETPDGHEHRPVGAADKCTSMGAALTRAHWHCDRMAEGAAA